MEAEKRWGQPQDSAIFLAELAEANLAHDVTPSWVFSLTWGCQRNPSSDGQWPVRWYPLNRRVRFDRQPMQATDECPTLTQSYPSEACLRGACLS
jgi:hypothetical protein